MTNAFKQRKLNAPSNALAPVRIIIIEASLNTRFFCALLALLVSSCMAPHTHLSSTDQLQEALRENPGDWGIKLELAQALKAETRFEDAIRLLDPEDITHRGQKIPAEAQTLLIELYADSSRLKKAQAALLSFFQKSTDIKTTEKARIQALFFRVTKLLLTKSTAQNLHRFSKPLLERAHRLQLMEDNREAWLQIFEARLEKLSKAGYDAEVVALGNRLLNGELPPTEAHFEIGVCALARPSNQRTASPVVANALQRYLRLATTPKSQAQMAFKTARAFAKKFAARRALKHLDAALKLDPELHEARLLKIRLLLQINYADAARKTIREHLESVSPGTTHLKELGKIIPILVQFNKHNDAISLALQESSKVSLKTDPNYLLSTLRLASTAAKSRKDREKIVAYISALSKTAEKADDRLSLAKLLVRLNAPNKAFKTLSRDCLNGNDEITLTCLKIAADLKKKRQVRRYAKSLMRPQSNTRTASEGLVVLGSFGYNKLAKKLAQVLIKRPDAPWQLYRDELSRLLDTGAKRKEIQHFLNQEAQALTFRIPRERIALLLEQNKLPSLASEWYRKAADASENEDEKSKNLLSSLRLQKPTTAKQKKQYGESLEWILETAHQRADTVQSVLELSTPHPFLKHIRKKALAHLYDLKVLSAEEYLDLAKFYLDDNQLLDAERTIASALDSSRNPTKFMKELITLFHRKGKVSVFIKILNSSNPEVRENKDLVLQAASTLSRRAQPGDARTLYELAIKTSFNNAKALQQIGRSLEHRAYLDLALQSVLRAHELEPSDDSSKSLIRLNLKLERPKEAFSLAQSYARASGDPFNSWNNLGQLFARQFYFQEAIDCYMRAFALRAHAPPKPLLRTLLHLQHRFGSKDQIQPLVAQLIPRDQIHMASDRDILIVVDALKKAGKSREALYYEKKRAESREQDPARWFSLGRLQLSAGQEPEALNSFASSYKSGLPDQRPSLLKEIVEALIDQSQSDLALKLLERLEQSFPQDLATEVVRAQVFFSLGRLKIGQEHMLSALKKLTNPKKEWAYMSDVYTTDIPTYLRTEFVNQALKIFPGHPTIARELGLLRLSEGNLERALGAFNQIKVTQPDEAFHIGRILLNQGHLKAAHSFFKTSAVLVREENARQILPDYLRLTRTLYGSKETRKALGEIMSKYPKQGWLLRASGLAFIEAGMIEDARRLIQKSMAGEGGDESEKLLGIIAYWSGNKTKAQEHFERFVALNTSNGTAPTSEDQQNSIKRHLDVAHFLSNEGDFDGALIWTQKSSLLPGGRIKSLVAEAFHALRAKRSEQAVQAFSAALREKAARALMESDALMELALKSDEGCSLLPAIAALPKDIGPIGMYAEYRLGLSCNGRSEEAFGNLLLIADAGIPEVPAFAAHTALKWGKFEQAEQLLTAYIQKWGARILNREGKSGSDALLNLLTSINMQNKEDPKGEIRKILDHLWRNAQQPLETLEHLSRILGARFGEWDLAAEYSDQLLQIKSQDKKLWLIRVDIAIQRSQDDVFNVLKRLHAANGPKDQAFQQIRNVWLETGEVEALESVRNILKMPPSATSTKNLFSRFEEAFLELDLKKARKIAKSAIRASNSSLLIYHKVIGPIERVGWSSLAQELIDEGRQKFPQDPALFWWATKQSLAQPEKRSDAIKDLIRWLTKNGLNPITEAHSVVPNALSLYAALSSEELTQVFTALIQAPQTKQSSLLKALVALKQQDEKALMRAVHEIDEKGLQTEQTLYLLFKESIRKHFIQGSLDIAMRVRKWTGLLSASQRLCYELESLLVHTDMNDPLRKTIGIVGLKILKDYQKVAKSPVSLTTNLASFRSAIGDSEGAESAFRVLTEYLPGVASTQNNFAYHFAVHGTKPEQGLELVERALKLEPSGSPYYLDTRAWLLYRKGAYQQAYSDVLNSIRTGARLRNFSSEESQIHAAEIALKRGDLQSTKKHALRALLTAPHGAIQDRARTLLGTTFHEQ